jgi:hypothetical protein
MKAFVIEDEKTTLADMRRMMDFQFVDGMTRRTIIYQEIQGWCSSSPNPHGWPNNMIHKYYFGFYSSGEQKNPELIPVSIHTYSVVTFGGDASSLQQHCENILVADAVNLRAIGEDVTADLIIIPRRFKSTIQLIEVIYVTSSESQIGPIANEYLNRYVTEEDERDLQARDGDGRRYGNYEYGQDTFGTKHQDISKDYLMEQKGREETRESAQFWL